MGSQYNVATWVEELGSTKTCWRSKHLSKRAKVPNLAQAAKLKLVVAVKGRGGPYIPSLYAQRLLMNPKYNVATSVEEFIRIRKYWRSKHLSKRVKSAKSGPGGQIVAVCPHAKAIYSFNTCPKASHGTQIQCCNMRRKNGKHQIILEEQAALLKWVKVPNTWPSQPDRSCWSL
jgi:hypothetical protein